MKDGSKRVQENETLGSIRDQRENRCSRRRRYNIHIVGVPEEEKQNDIELRCKTII